MGATASSSSQGWKKSLPAVAEATRKTVAQTAATATRRQRGAELRGQTADAKKMAIGASITTSQRQGNCKKRRLGSRFQTGSEMGSSRKRITAGMSARGIHQRRFGGRVWRRHGTRSLQARVGGR